ncbi:hypothetical protein C1G86_0234 [Dehalococcoides mccartyi]|uniref:Uncharacterized protein n=1 Tax=Dehalococcoides mccartyi TaxID=61435 RepID=A0A328ETD2_9CHLR|nr:hypothetical protein C1G87_0248 [Dehalococcoides mccartyi]RAL70641.1 hypothetical protein C1G86_0234 [Dehalococcoides mccartyi]
MFPFWLARLPEQGLKCGACWFPPLKQSYLGVPGFVGLAFNSSDR